jgi:Fe2+ or Zn2+ uptake regulation protein
VGLRRTPQREILLGLVQSSTDHPTAEWLHQEARQILPDISLATVYRTLRMLKEKGLVYEFSGGASPSRYDGNPGEHEHVRCVRCGAVENVTLPELADLREHVAARTGFRMGRYPMVFHGLCESCARVTREARAGDPNGGEGAGR